MKKNVVIIGAGPAGLTSGYELLKRSKDYNVTIVEEDSIVGGISKTVNYHGNRMDMGGHRFFSKVNKVNEWWESFLPTQGKMPYDDILLNRKSTVKKGGPNPEKTDDVMLKRNRISRIYFKNKFFDYPISLKWSTIRNMGLFTTIVVGFSYLKSCIFKRKEKSLEDFYINRFGKKLYSMFFENYTENLWGIHPSKISPDWGAQRVKGLSISAILKDIFGKIFKKKNRHIETSLIEEFSYPKYGPGQLWELVANKISKMGGNIITSAKVIKINKTKKNNITSVTYIKDNKKIVLKGDIFISSMPIKDLINDMNDVPKEYQKIASGLPYRDYLTIGLLVNKLSVTNKTNVKTINDNIPDNWIYIHNKDVKLGRIQIYNNWSPYMVKDINNTVWIGLEYFCNENDSFWKKSDNSLINLGIKELIKIGIIDDDKYLDAHVERVKKAYPAYFGTYKNFDKLKEYLNSINNLYCVGRNGQHRYNNMDHSMCTSFETVDNIINSINNKDNIWGVNTEKEYHEEKYISK